MNTWTEVAYAPNIDTTFIMKYKQNEDGLICYEEVIGFYHGEPEDQWTEYYKDKGVKWEVEE